jgi:O-antigen/teichoic acid export membrane protein
VARNYARTIAAAIPFKVANIILGLGVFFYLSPWMIHSFGDYYYGVYVLANTIVSYFALSEFGLGSAIEREVGVALGARKYRQANNLFVHGALLFFFIGIIVALFSICLGFVLWLIQPTVHILALLIGIIGLTLSCGLIFQPWFSALNAQLKFATVYKYTLCVTILDAMASVILLSLHQGVVVFVAIHFVLLLCARLVLMVVVWQQTLWLSVRKVVFAKKYFRTLLFYSMKTFGVRVAAMLQTKLDDIVVGVAISVSKVTHYSIAMDINNKGNGLSVFFMEMLNPLFSFLHGEKNIPRFQAAYTLIWKVILLLATFTFSILVFLGYDFIGLWLGAGYGDAYVPLVLLACSYLFQRCHGPGETILFTQNRHQIYAYMSIADGLINLALSLTFVLVAKLGITGVALGTLCSAVITRLIVQPILIARAIDYTVRRYYGFMLGYMGIFLSIYALINWGMHRLVLSPSYPVLFLYACGLAVGLIVNFFIVFDCDERQQLLRLHRS